MDLPSLPSGRTGHEHLRCPFCRYSFRGLAGALIRCPECGRTTHRDDLIAGRRLDWWGTEEYARLAAPAAAATFGGLLLVVPILPVCLALENATPAVTLLSLGVAGWALLVRRGARDGRLLESLRLMALLHVIYLGYLVSMFLLPAGAIAVAMSLGQGALGNVEPMIRPFVLGVLGLGLGLAGFAFLNWLDHRVGVRCAQRQQQRDRAGRPDPAPPPED